MKVYIKEWPNKTATLMTENGQVIWTFSSVAEARDVCRAWFRLSDEEVQYDGEAGTDPSAAACLKGGPKKRVVIEPKVPISQGQSPVSPITISTLSNWTSSSSASI